MSDDQIPSVSPTFTESELQQLQEDDLKAGKFIGRTLVIMFLYSAILMGGVIWWTFNRISERPANKPFASDSNSP